MKRSSAAPTPIIIGDTVANDFARKRVLVPSPRNNPDRPPSDLVWSLEGERGGQQWDVRFVPPMGSASETFREAVEAELDRLSSLFDRHNADSEISRFNYADEGFHPITEGFWSLLTIALDIADDVNGAVDPTLGALIDLWGFGPAGPRPALLPIPSPNEIDTARSASGWNRLRLNRAEQSALQSGSMKLDLTALHDGHAVDGASAVLTGLGATSHLIRIGSTLKGVGVKPDAQPWWVDIKDIEGSSAPETVAAMFDLAVSTCATEANAFAHNGQVYSHILEGSTGLPVNNGIVQVTVFDACATRADALATALTVQGPQDGPELAAALDIAAQFTVRTAEGLAEIVTPAFAAMSEEEPS